jgi:transcriptional regulator with XRE-family HTH domain
LCRGHYNGKRTKWVRANIWQGPVAITGTTRRLRALIALGWPQAELARQTGLPTCTISHLVRGDIDRTSRRNAAVVYDLYERLSMTPGPSDWQRQRAKEAGWAPPLAWDDDSIDNPDATPHLGENRYVPWIERYLELRDLGCTDLEISMKLGAKPDSMLRQMIRHGITPSPELTAASHTRRYRRKQVAS